MFCKKCGKEIADGLTTCPECNAATQASQVSLDSVSNGAKGFVDGYKNFGSLSKTNKIIHIAVPVVAVVVIVLILSLVFSDKYVSMVKDGHLEAFSKTETVGEAFDGFFASPEWDSFKSDKGKRIVEFNGECEYLGDDVKVCIQFEIDEDDEEFEIYYADVDGEKMSDFEILALFEAVYDE